MSLAKKKLGAAGEDLAVSKLKKMGYKILERNFRCRLGEIDVIARDGDSLVFVEVRTRSMPSFGDPAESISWQKRRKITRLAGWYVSAKKWETFPVRFDVVAVDLAGPSPRIDVLQGAFYACD